MGFPGETETDLAELHAFISAARLDAIGVFGYSDEEGTAAAGFPDKIDAARIADRVTNLSLLADQVCARRAEDRIGSEVEVLIGTNGTGWAAHQAPESDGMVTIKGLAVRAGDLVRARITGTHGVDLTAEPT